MVISEHVAASSWANFPSGILQLMGDRLHNGDIIACRGVNKAWRVEFSSLIQSLPLVRVLLLQQHQHHKRGGGTGQTWWDSSGDAACFSGASEVVLELLLDQRHHTQLASALWQCLQRLSCMDHLRISERLQDVRGQHVATMPGLLRRWADMDAPVHPVMHKLKSLKLETLSAPCSGGLALFAQKQSLTKLDMRQSPVDAECMHLLSHWTQLRELDICIDHVNNYGVGIDDALLSLSNLRHLHTLHLNGCHMVHKATLVRLLSSFTSLRSLELDDRMPYWEDYMSSKTLHSLTSLSVRGVQADSSWHHIASLPLLRALSTVTPITGPLQRETYMEAHNLSGLPLMWTGAACGRYLQSLHIQVASELNLAGLGNLTRVLHLSLSGEELSKPNDLVFEVCQLKLLKSLTLNDVLCMDDTSLNRMALNWPLLQTLNYRFPSNRLTAKGFTWFQNIPDLKCLNLSNGLGQHVMEIDPLDLPHCLRFLTLVTTKFKTRPIVGFWNSKSKGSKKEIPLVHHFPLESLKLTTNYMSVAYITAMLKTWTDLTSLDISHSGVSLNASYDVFDNLRHLQRLRCLSLRLSALVFSRAQLTKPLKELHNLRQLCLAPIDSFSVSNDGRMGMLRLTELTQLTHLKLVNVEGAFSAGLVQRMPQCQISCA